MVCTLMPLIVAAENSPAKTTEPSAKDAASKFAIMKTQAESGDATAQFDLGNHYSSGVGVPKDYAIAADWYRKAALQGHAKAAYNLGNRSYFGVADVPQSYTEAFKWFKISAEKGNCRAQYRLGEMYEKGQGLDKDPIAAFLWHRKAAEQGFPHSQLALAIMYANGTGTPKDYTAAMKWYLLAADAGLAVAHNNIGDMYENGQGVEKDLVEAYARYAVTVELCVPQAAEWRDRVEKSLTQEQLRKGKARKKEIMERTMETVGKIARNIKEL